MKRRLLRTMTPTNLSTRLRALYAAFQARWADEALSIVQRGLVAEVFVADRAVLAAPTGLQFLDPDFPHAQLRSVYLGVGPEILRLRLTAPALRAGFYVDVAAFAADGNTRAPSSQGATYFFRAGGISAEQRWGVREEGHLLGFRFAVQPCAPDFADFRSFLARRGLAKQISANHEAALVRAMLVHVPTNPHPEGDLAHARHARLGGPDARRPLRT